MKHMVRLNLNVSDDLAMRLRERAKESGYDDIERFAESLLQAELEDEDLEALLLERLDDPRPKIEFTSEFQRSFLREIEEQRARGKNTPK